MQRELIAFVEDVIEAESALVCIAAERLGGEEQVGSGVGMRIEMNQFERNRVQHLGGNLIIGKGLAAEVVDQRGGFAGLRIGESGEVSCALGIARYRCALRDSLAIVDAVVV